MTLRPLPPRTSLHSLDADERALAKSLPRLQGRTMPGPDLDASILAAAQAAARPTRPSTFPARPRVRWITSAALAASMVLAVGIAWQLRPLPALEYAQPAAQSETADVTAVQMIEPAPYDLPARNTQSAWALEKAAAARLANRQDVGTKVASPSPAEGRVQTRTAPPSPPVLPTSPPPPAPPAPPAPPQPAPAAATAASAYVGSRATSLEASSNKGLDAAAAEYAAGARVPAPTAAARTSSDGVARGATRASADMSGTMERSQQTAPKTASSSVLPELRNEAFVAADAGFVGDPDQDIPPATVDSPQVRDAWLHRIEELLEQGERQDAKDSLTEFRRRYPATVLSARLRELEIES